MKYTMISTDMKFIQLFLVLTITSLLCTTFAQDKRIIKGNITDLSGAPLPLVTVFVKNSGEGTIANDKGEYKLSTKIKGAITAVYSLVGYKQESRTIDLGKNAETIIDVRMEELVLKMKDVVITASSFSSNKGKGVVLNKMDVLMTPGGAADVFQSLKTLPGLTQVSESAELYVRGGEPIETIAIIDGAVMYHPFTLESDYGGLFSNVKTNFIKDLFFSSGGFSAKYGNALSGVIDIETKGVPERTNIVSGLSMANGSLSAEVPFLMNAAGFMFEYDRSFTKPIFWLNGGSDRFTTTPNSDNFTSSFVLNYSKTGRIKILGIMANDDEGVLVERAEYTGEFDGASKNRYINSSWSDILWGNLVMKSSISYNKYSNNWKLGLLDLTQDDRTYTWRNDFDKTLTTSSRLLTGFEFEDRKVNYTGIIPGDDNNISPTGEKKYLDAVFAGGRFGAYAELEIAKPLGINELSVTAGLRYDCVTKINSEWFNPRLNLGYKISGTSTVMIATGIFNQVNDPRLYSISDGNPHLKPMKAVHYIGSYDYHYTTENSFRVEIYRKNYTELPLKNALVNYTNDGYGFAQGVDFIIKGSLDIGLNGWFSYGYIDSKRYWMDFSKETFSSTDVTHNLTLILKYPLTSDLQIGTNIKYATGKPFTPITGSNYNATYGYYEPVEGETNSARYPSYRRIDVRLTYFTNIFEKYRLIIFMEGLNILNLNNIFGYSYSPDYSKSQDIKSYFGRRMVVVGINLMY